MTVDRMTARVWAMDYAPWIGDPDDAKPSRLLDGAEVELTLSESWSPYVRATIKVPWRSFPIRTVSLGPTGAVTGTAIDPRTTYKKYGIRIDRHFGTDENSLAAWTKALPIGAWAGGAHQSQSHLTDSTGVEVARNIGINPLCAAGGAGITSNSAAAMPITRGVTLPTPTPDGITTGARITRTATTPSQYAASSYNVDGLANVRPLSSTGAWVMVTEDGYRAAISASTAPAGPTLTAGVWTWITTTTPTAANVHLGLVVTRTSGANASTSVVTYVTGVTTVPGSVAPTRAIHGGITRSVSQMTARGLPRIASTWPTWYEGAPKNGQTLTAFVTLDDTSIDFGADMVTFSCIGNEIELQERVEADDVGITGTTLRYGVNDLLARLGVGSLYECPDRTVDALVWRAGSSAWSAVETWVNDADHALICDELGRWRILSREGVGGPLHTWPVGDLISYRQELSRGGDWYQNVHMRWVTRIYNPVTEKVDEQSVWAWNGTGFLNHWNPAGTPPTAARRLFITREVTKLPTQLEAQEAVRTVRNRALSKGNQIIVERTADLTVRPLDRLTIPGVSPQASWWGTYAASLHRVSEITWRLPESTMTVTTRGAN